MSSVTYRDPLASLPASLPPLPENSPATGRTPLVNLPRHDDGQGTLSPWYRSYPEEIDSSKNAFDFHIYYGTDAQKAHARRLQERIRREFPELTIYPFKDAPVGPHPLPMFDVETCTPVQFGALFGFLVAFRGDLSILIHPNSLGSELQDHTTKATWMGERLELNTAPLRKDERRYSAVKPGPGPRGPA